jgi:quinol-cytochrome oxidoreductase complex cytochrome b subunit
VHGTTHVGAVSPRRTDQLHDKAAGGRDPEWRSTGDMQNLIDWIDTRFPLTALWESQWGKYVAPKNFNFWYSFGVLAGLVLVMQIVTGIFLTMNYKADAARAFDSVVK